MKAINLEYKRQTGRTSRMLADVKTAYEAGRDCVVIVRSGDDEVQSIINRLNLPIPQSSESRPSVTVLRHDMATFFDWQALKFISGPYVGAALFIDHDALEQVYRNILDAWTKYDEPPETIPGLANTPEEMAALVAKTKYQAPPVETTAEHSENL